MIEDRRVSEINQLLHLHVVNTLFVYQHYLVLFSLSNKIYTMQQRSNSDRKYEGIGPFV